MKTINLNEIIYYINESFDNEKELVEIVVEQADSLRNNAVPMI